MERRPYTGIVLAGGKSSRMGTDKGLLMLGGMRFAEHVLSALQPVTSSLIIVANNPEYRHLGFPVYTDLVKDCGPIGGIYTGLCSSTNERNLVLSCDLPFMTTAMLRHIISCDEAGKEITIPTLGGRPEPLCGVYSKNCIPGLARLIGEGKRKLKDILPAFNTSYVPLAGVAGTERDFMNINTREDMLNAQTIHTK